MKEQVLVYEIKSSANINADKLFSPDRKYFYWNDTMFRNLNLDDFVFVVNKHSNFVLFAKLNQTNIPVTINADKTFFSDLNTQYEVSGKWDKFIRLEIIAEYLVPQNWKWKSLGSSETTYLNGERINIEKSTNRITNINQLKQLSQDQLYNEVLDSCLKNFTQSHLKPDGIYTIQNDNQVSSSSTISNKVVIQHAYNYIKSKGFQYQFEEIANFYLSLCAKPFVILAGISGTGKTQLPKKFAEAVGFNLEEQVKLVPVRPDWTDGSELLGYNSIDRKFIPKDLTLLIQKAHLNSETPYFFILDEMNLARVEHYFSDYLSIIETRRRNPDKKIVTDKILRQEMLNGSNNSKEFENIWLPPNLYLIGTVNMDETTHSFSRKVLDRANSIEMNEVDLKWIETKDQTPGKLQNVTNTLFEAPYLNSSDIPKEDKESISKEMNLLIEVNSILQKADLHFAYRMRDEIAFYLILNKKHELIDETIAFDFQIVQKILPRIHGSSERIQKVLIELICLLEKGEKGNIRTDVEFSEIEKQFPIDSLKYRRASKKILFMLKRFDDDRFTSFWL